MIELGRVWEPMVSVGVLGCALTSPALMQARPTVTM